MRKYFRTFGANERPAIAKVSASLGEGPKTARRPQIGDDGRENRKFSRLRRANLEKPWKKVLIKLRRALLMGLAGPCPYKSTEKLFREVRKGPLCFLPELRFALA